MVEIVKKLVWKTGEYIVEYEIGDWADLVLYNGEIYFGDIIDIQSKYIVLEYDYKNIKIYINQIKLFI